MKVTDSLLAENARFILRQAIDAAQGIIIEIEDPTGTVIQPAFRAKQVLYRFKQENSDFANIQIRLSPDDPDRELWLINQREF